MRRLGGVSVVKPGELVDIVEMSPLTLADRRIYNLLLANAWDKLAEPVQHMISKRELQGTLHKGTDRLEELPTSIAPAPKKAGEDQAIGRSRGGLSTKIHALVDALGNPTGFFLTGGEAHDLVGADRLLPTMEADMLIADKAFDADARVLEPLAAVGKTAVIPAAAGISASDARNA